jgi:hypothetical protein
MSDVPLSSFAWRVAAAINPAHALRAFPVLGLFLSALIANDALVGFAGARWMRLWHAGLKVALFTWLSRRMTRLCLAFADQLLVAEHLADDLPGLRLGFFPEMAHDNLLQSRTAGKRQCFRSNTGIIDPF